LYNLFIEKDGTLLEINPMTEDATGEGEWRMNVS
jgi:succinyl-CoA synthetase beta subunit